MVIKKVVEGLKLFQHGQIHLPSPMPLSRPCLLSNGHALHLWLVRELQIHLYLSPGLVLDHPLPHVPHLPHHSSLRLSPFPRETHPHLGNESTAQVLTNLWPLLLLELLPQCRGRTAPAQPLRFLEVQLVQSGTQGVTQPAWVPFYPDPTPVLPHPRQAGQIHLVALPLALLLFFIPIGPPVGDPRHWRSGELTVFHLLLLSRRWCMLPSGEATRASVWSDCWGT